MILFDNIQEQIINHLRRAKKNIKISVTWFTNNEIFSELLHVLETKKNIQVELVVLNDRINNKSQGNDFQKLIDFGGKFYYSNIENLVHHKFMIIDDKLVMSGSYNWTYYAEKRNWENLNIIKRRKIVKGFVGEFQKIIDHHDKIENINEKALKHKSIDSKDYLEKEYELQVERLLVQGEKIKAGQLIFEISKDDFLSKNLKAKKQELLKEVNTSDIFEYSPYEIGLEYETGYQTAIPAFQKLPFSISKFGHTTIDNQINVTTNIQKFNGFAQTMFTLKLNNIKKSPIKTKKVRYDFSLDTKGTLKVIMRELDGYNYIDPKETSIKYWR